MLDKPILSIENPTMFPINIPINNAACANSFEKKKLRMMNPTEGIEVKSLAFEFDLTKLTAIVSCL